MNFYSKNCVLILVFAFLLICFPLWNKALQEGKKEICSWKYLFWPVFRVFPHEADICAEGWAALVQMCDLRGPDTAHKMWLIPFDSLWINRFSPAEPLWLVCSLSRGLGSSETKLQTQARLWIACAGTSRQSSDKSLSLCRTFSVSVWDVLWMIWLEIWRLCDLWECGPYPQRTVILFGMKEAKIQGKSVVLWSTTSGQVPAVGMDAPSVSCAASGEAQGALVSPDPKGFMVLWCEHSSMQNEVKTLNQMVSAGLCGNNCSDLKMTAMKKWGEGLIKTNCASSAAGSLLLNYLNVFHPLFSDDISFSQEIFFFFQQLVSVQINDL